MNLLPPLLILLAASCTVPVAEAGAKGRELAGANSFLHTGQTLPTGRQGAGMVMLKSNVVVFGGDSGGGASGCSTGTDMQGAETARNAQLAVNAAGLVVADDDDCLRALFVVQNTKMTCIFTTWPRIFGALFHGFPGMPGRQPDRTWGLRWRAPRLIGPLCLVALVVSACHPRCTQGCTLGAHAYNEA